MITGIIFLIISIVSAILVIKTDLEDDVVEVGNFLDRIENRGALYLGILVLFVLGFFLIIKNI